MDDHMTDIDRFDKITASIVSAILRVDGETKSRKWAWRVITGREKEKPPNWDQQRGLDHEEDAIGSLEAELGLLALPGRFVCHPSIAWLGASPDGFLIEDDKIIPIEAKCPRVLHDKIPPIYRAQMQTQLEVCNAEYGYFVSWTETGQWVHKEYRDRAWWAEAVKTLTWFWETYVVPDIEPPKSERRRKNVDSGRVGKSKPVCDGESPCGVAVVGGSVDVGYVSGGGCTGDAVEGGKDYKQSRKQTGKVSRRDASASDDAGGNARAFFQSRALREK